MSRALTSLPMVNPTISSSGLKTKASSGSGTHQRVSRRTRIGSPEPATRLPIPSAHVVTDGESDDLELGAQDQGQLGLGNTPAGVASDTYRFSRTGDAAPDPERSRRYRW